MKTTRCYHIILAFLVLCCFASELSAVQYLSGSISRDTTLKKRSGPYVLRNDVTIAKNVTLTIEPGTTLLFVPSSGGKKTPYSTDNTDLIVFGRLKAEGTFDSPISIGSSDKNNWGAIYFTSDCESDSRLKNCNILKGRIIINGSSPLVRYCNIRGGGGIEIGHKSCAEIKNNNIYYNSVGVHLWVDSSAVILVNNYIVYNRYGVLISGFDAEKTKLTNNNIYGNLDYDVVLETAADIDVTGNYWGSLDSSEISKKVFDSFDRPSLGKATYQPFLKKENVMVWKLKLDADIRPPGEISSMEISVPRETKRAPVGFFQIKGKRIGIRPRIGIIFPLYHAVYFEYSAEALPSLGLKLVYDERWSVDACYEYAGFSSKPGTYRQEYSEMKYDCLGLSFCCRVLPSHSLSPTASLGMGLYRLRYKNMKYQGTVDVLESPLQPSEPKTSALGLNAAVGASVSFQKRFEGELELKYITVQSEESTEKAVSPSFLALSVSVLMFF